MLYLNLLTFCGILLTIVISMLLYRLWSGWRAVDSYLSRPFSIATLVAVEVAWLFFGAPAMVELMSLPIIPK